MATDRATVVAFWKLHPSWPAAQIAAHFGGEDQWNHTTLRQWKSRYVTPFVMPPPSKPQAQAELPLPSSTETVSESGETVPSKKRDQELAELGLTPEDVDGRDMTYPGLTPERQARIVKLLTLGVPQGVAARRVGIGEVTYYGWRTRGRREQSGVYRDFLVETDEALAVAETRLVGFVRKAAKDGDWRAAQFLLEQRFPQRWREHKILETQGGDGAPGAPAVVVQVQGIATVQFASMSPEQIAALAGHSLDREVPALAVIAEAIEPTIEK